MSPASPEPVAVAILAKAPVPGTVKTRLVMMLGVDGAAALQARFIEAALDTALAAEVGPVRLWCSPDTRHPFFASAAARFSVALLRQTDGDLGARMLAAVSHQAGPTIVIGADCPALTTAHLRDAAAVLRSGTDAVVCPAEDGGYVLIGLRRPEPVVFEGIAWGSETVMLETRGRLTRGGLSWREPAVLWDVDRPTDVRRMRREGFLTLLEGVDRPLRAPPPTANPMGGKAEPPG